ncbi:MAG: flagellar biosynthesis protein FlhA [Methylobacteriaceae bacterium]|nr:flagellar biosynthesis protein FlhA [Methylobacteriaceae bacterium]MCO5086063.1 flagellar biosynthesis protein FlhA [Methylobacteriaceae bacterium]
MNSPLHGSATKERSNSFDMLFASGIVLILSIFFLPTPPILIDLGLALSISVSVLILMVALWIEKPLEFSAFPTILLVSTMLRLSLNIATTRLILSHGSEGISAAGYVIGGFARLVMSGDFVIGIVVFTILITVNFLVITKGATRIAEVGARFTLDAIPGKQMAIDADLSAGLIDDKQAQARRRELEEESAFFGSMDGASKFVRGDAIAGLIILAVNIFGGILIGITRHNMSAADAVNIFTKLSVGDGLVSQIPALIVSLAAGLLVSKGGTRGSADQAVVGQLTRHPRALFLAGGLMFILALIPGLPFLPFALLGSLLAFSGVAIPRHLARISASELLRETEAERNVADAESDSVREYLRATEIELCIGQQLASRVVPTFGEMSHRVAKMRRKFARRYGFVIPDIKLSNSMDLPPRVYQIRIHDAAIASVEIPVGDSLVIFGDGPKPDLIGEPTREPAFGMNAMWISPAFVAEAKRAGYDPVDNISVILTHLSEALRNNLAQLFSYRDMRALLDTLDPEYRKLLEEICPAQISYSGLLSIFKALLAERISIRSLNLILEAIAEAVPHLRRVEQIVEHVRIRIAPQICNEVVVDGVLNIVRAGARWDQTFHRHLKRDAKGEIVEFDIDPPLIEQFQSEAKAALSSFLDRGEAFVLVTTPENRPYLRMITERLFPNISVLSTLEIARGVNIKTLGSIS